MSSSEQKILKPEVPEKAKESSPGKSQSPASAAESSSAPVKSRKPFPWPLLLFFVIAASAGGLLAWEWNQQDYMLIMRTSWVALCSFLPGLLLMVVIGSIAQIRKRPIISSISLILGGAGLGSCYWAIQQIVQNAGDFLK